MTDEPIILPDNSAANNATSAADSPEPVADANPAVASNTAQQTATQEEALDAMKNYKLVPSPSAETGQGSNWTGFAIIALLVLGTTAAGHYAYQYLPPNTPPAATQPVVASDLVKVRDVRKHYLQAQQGDGKIVLRTGGNLSWRLNNPGKIVHDDFTRANGALGSDGKYAIFPSAEAGMAAASKLLFDTAPYKDMSIADGIAKWAPKKDGYKPDVYAKTVALAAGVPVTTKLSDLTPDQRKKFLGAMRGMERWTEGKVRVFANEEEFKAKGW